MKHKCIYISRLSYFFLFCASPVETPAAAAADARVVRAVTPAPSPEAPAPGPGGGGDGSPSAAPAGESDGLVSVTLEDKACEVMLLEEFEFE